MYDVGWRRLSGISPFLGDNDAETFSNISEEEYEFDEDYFGSLSDDSMDFLEKLLVKDQKCVWLQLCYLCTL
jgi:myosin-light-chain kinase